MSTLTLQEKKQRNTGAVVSAAIHAALLLLFLFWQLGYTPQVEETDGGGILINFGNSETGLGDETPQSQDVATPTPPQPKAEPQKIEQVVTQDIEDAPSITKPKKEITKPVETPVKPNKSTVVTPPVKEEPQKPKVIAKFGNNTSTSQGNTPGPGDKGKEFGNPNTNGMSEIGGGSNPLGTGGTGIGFNLSGRSMRQRPSINDNSQKTGKVVVKIKVDKNGNVISAAATRSGSTTEDSYLFSIAEKAAMQTKFSVSPDMIEQFGTMTFTFKVK